MNEQGRKEALNSHSSCTTQLSQTPDLSKTFPSLDPTGSSQQHLWGFGLGWGPTPWWAHGEAEVPREEVTFSRSPQSPL